MEKKVTIKDVAKLAGVTPAVVSRVFNSDETLNIKEETRTAVFEAIKMLDYRPNSIARSLRTSTSNAIGVLVPDIMNPFLYRDHQRYSDCFKIIDLFDCFMRYE